VINQFKIGVFYLPMPFKYISKRERRQLDDPDVDSEQETGFFGLSPTSAAGDTNVARPDPTSFAGRAHADPVAAKPKIVVTRAPKDDESKPTAGQKKSGKVSAAGQATLAKVFGARSTEDGPRRQLRRYVRDEEKCPGNPGHPCGKNRGDKPLCWSCEKTRREIESRCAKFYECGMHRHWIPDLGDYSGPFCSEHYKEYRDNPPNCRYHDDTPAEPGCHNVVAWDHATRDWFLDCISCKHLLDKVCPGCGTGFRYRNKKTKTMSDFCRDCEQTQGPRRDGYQRTPVWDDIDQRETGANVSKKQRKRKQAGARRPPLEGGPKQYPEELLVENSDGGFVEPVQHKDF